MSETIIESVVGMGFERSKVLKAIENLYEPITITEIIEEILNPKQASTATTNTNVPTSFNEVVEQGTNLNTTDPETSFNNNLTRPIPIRQQYLYNVDNGENPTELLSSEHPRDSHVALDDIKHLFDNDPIQNTHRNNQTNININQNTNAMLDSKTFENENNNVVDKSQQEIENWWDIPWPKNPFEKIRIEGTPCGLINVGNTCYVNSMIQSYFMLPQFRKKIILFETINEEIENLNDKQSNEKKIDLQELKMIDQLQRLFSSMISSNLRFVNPKRTIKMLFNTNDVDEFFKFGQQNDVLEFHDKFCEKIEQGINCLIKLKNLKEQPIQTDPEKEGEKEPEKEGEKHKDKEKEKEKEEKKEKKKEKQQQQQSKEIEKEIEKETKIKTEKEIIEKTWMSDLFYGESAISITGIDEQKKEFEYINHEKLGRIILDIKYGDLYSSLDSYTLETGIKYKIQSKYKTTVSKETSFENLPKILIFQLQRAVFDKNTLQSKKNNQPFKFEKQIFLDRYIYKNLEKRRNSRILLKKLKLEKEELLNELKKLNNYNETNMSLVQSLKHVEKYFKIINKDDDDDVNSDLIKGQKRNDLNRAKTIIFKHKTQIKEKIQNLNNTIADIQNKINNIFVTEKTVGYTIHSVLIHRGNVRSGHYFSFVYDSFNENWWKFNDREVTIIDEEEAMRSSIGEKDSTTNAYCLIYVTSDFDKTDLNKSITNHRKIIPTEIKQEVQHQNQLFQQEVEKWKKEEEKKKIKKEIEEYERIINNKISILGTKLNVHNSTAKRYPLKSLKYYMILCNKKNICKYLLLKEHLNQVKMENVEENNDELEKLMGVEYDENEIETEKEKEKEKEIEIEREKKKKKIIKKIINQNINEITNEIQRISFNYSRFLTCHELLVSAFKNMYSHRYNQALLEIYAIMKKVEKYQIQEMNINFKNLLNLCIKEIYTQTYKQFKNLFLNLYFDNSNKNNSPIKIIKIAHKISHLISQSNIPEKKDPILQILFPEMIQKSKKLHSNMVSKLQRLKLKFNNTDNIDLISQINSILEFFENKIQFESIEIPLPNTNQIHKIKKTLYKDFKNSYRNISHRFTNL
ncbi:specific protease [Anaeramoeba flamelloides]|uniref:Specific protease n=1 Tax=Anaeramoeba flamelloides TaxID=1746091 RepID=A0AAV8A9R3_9EUKA|nr:specific protease [Anaeramoeba flamelloides]